VADGPAPGPPDSRTHVTNEEAIVTSNADTEAQRPSVATVCEQLGVPEVDRNLFTRWATELSDEHNMDALNSYVDVMVADRCAHPAADLLTELIKSGVAGEDLTADELRTAVVAMLALASDSECATPRR